VVLEKDREDQLGRSHEKGETVLKYQGRQECHTMERRKAVGHILHRNCLLKHVIQGKIEGRMEVKGRRGRNRKQLLDKFKENSG
jgi:hypothetical protein